MDRPLENPRTTTWKRENGNYWSVRGAPAMVELAALCCHKLKPSPGVVYEMS